MNSNKRFVQSSEEDITNMKNRRFEQKTVKTTQWGVKVFKDCLLEIGRNSFVYK